MTYTLIGYCILIFFASVLVAKRLLVIVDVVGDSMLPTFKNGDRLMFCRSTPLTNIRLDTIVIFKWGFSKEEGYSLKRVRGVPGQTVVMRTVDLNPVAADLHSGAYQDDSVAWHVPESHYFLVGDNTYRTEEKPIYSVDSVINGPVPRKSIFGTFLLKL